jgi:hypothetical protein
MLRRDQHEYSEWEPLCDSPLSNPSVKAPVQANNETNKILPLSSCTRALGLPNLDILVILAFGECLCDPGDDAKSRAVAGSSVSPR